MAAPVHRKLVVIGDGACGKVRQGNAAVANVKVVLYNVISASDVSAVRVQQGPVPRGVRAHRVRDLRGRHRARQPGGRSEVDMYRQ